MKIRTVYLSLLVALGVIAFQPNGADASRLYDADGNYIKGGSSVPFSMKLSCGECHVVSRWTRTGGRYERPGKDEFGDVGRTFLAEKTQLGSVSETYSVPYPRHGVTKGFHFQMGRNVPWDQVQKDFYKLPEFTSSPGMYGKY